MATEAFVSLTTNDDYGNGAYVLGKSLRNSSTTRQLVLMVTSGVSDAMRARLMEVWDLLINIDQLDSMDKENLAQLKRPELGCTFSKLRAWKLTQFTKCVFLDADTLVLQNVDDLFERDEFSAVPDVGWPDCFNSGVFVFRPSDDTYNALIEHAEQHGSFDGGDQGLLNEFFSDWSQSDASRRIPFTYNTVSTAVYSYTPAFNKYGKNIKIVHFLGKVKPWHHYYDKTTGRVRSGPGSSGSKTDEIFTQMWWELHEGSTGSVNTWSQWEHARQHVPAQSRDKWEEGRPDYEGQDRFDNIMTYMSAMMLNSQPAPAAQDSNNLY